MSPRSLVLLLFGCSTPCIRSTLFLDLSFQGEVAAATNVDVVLSLDGAAEQHTPLHRARARAGDSVEIDVPDYAAGRQLSVRVDAILDQVHIGSGSQTFTLAPSCTRRSLAITALSCPGAADSDPMFVDLANGSDDPRYGGGAGNCAVKTLTFALKKAPGLIRLAPGIYRAPAETLPFTLRGSQQIDCGHATLQGDGVYAPKSSLVTVVFTGQANQLKDCVIVGGSATTFCVYVLSAGQGGGHRVDGCDISQCPATMGKGSAIEVDFKPADQLTVTGSTLHDTYFGISWEGPDHSGKMTNNRYDAIRADYIACFDADGGINPNVIGNDNVPSNGTDHHCQECAGCPF